MAVNVNITVFMNLTPRSSVYRHHLLKVFTLQGRQEISFWTIQYHIPEDSKLQSHHNSNHTGLV